MISLSSSVTWTIEHNKRNATFKCIPTFKYSSVEKGDERVIMEAVPISRASVEKKLVKPTKITKLVLDGFKSFGKYTELLFGDDFNVIIGPNGSGKSNVLDALCFVLGKSSSKQLRAEKSANLIYNGGKTKQPAKAAEVSLVFDNSNNVFPIAESEVKISRQVRMDGASKYKINNRAVTRQELLELLSAAKSIRMGTTSFYKETSSVLLK